MSFSALCDLKNTFFRKKIKILFLKKKFFPNFSNSCSLNIFEPKIWRRLGTFPSCFFFSWQSHSECSTFLQSSVHLFNWFSEKQEIADSILALSHKFFYASKSRGETKWSPLWVFLTLCDFFSKIFEFYQRVPPCIFLKFSVCKNVEWAWMASSEFFGIVRLFFKNTFFEKKF